MNEQKNQRLINIEKLIQGYININTPNCPNCTHFAYDLEICKLAQKRPPARIIANGCDKYESEIPF
jgi:hypothetical protein